MGSQILTRVITRTNVQYPDWIIDDALCEPDKQFVSSDRLNKWSVENILPIIKDAHKVEDIRLCANHVNIGSRGLSPHDHLPHAYTSVLYLTESLGQMVIDTGDGGIIKIKPEEGLLVTFPADMIHWVERSEHDEFRISFVSNYEYDTV